MASKKTARPRPRTKASAPDSGTRASSPVNELLLAALDRGDDNFQTGRLVCTFKEGGASQYIGELHGLRIADARDFTDQAVDFGGLSGADAIIFPEIGSCLIGGDAARAQGLSPTAELAADSAIASIDPEYFVFADGVADEFFRTLEGGIANPSEYLRGFLRAAETIAKDLGSSTPSPGSQSEEEAMALGATWGLNACKVPGSSRSGSGIKVAVLDTGMDLGHPDFAGRTVVSSSFIPGEAVQDLHSHGTHCIGTSCGTKSPSGSTPRYGIAYRALIHAGKVLSNSGSAVDGSVLAGMNWAVANRCEVISMSLGAPSPVQPAYTAAGKAALDNGLLMVAASGNAGGQTGSPANSPTILSVAALDTNLSVPSFSNFGKVEIAGPGVNVYSSVPRPTRYGYKSGTSMATPHVAGCAALWAETSATLRGQALWNKLQAAAKALSSPANRVGKGLVQAP